MLECVTHRVTSRLRWRLLWTSVFWYSTTSYSWSTPDLVLKTKQTVELSLWNAMAGFVKFNIDSRLCSVIEDRRTENKPAELAESISHKRIPLEKLKYRCLRNNRVSSGHPNTVWAFPSECLLLLRKNLKSERYETFGMPWIALCRRERIRSSVYKGITWSSGCLHAAQLFRPK